MGNYCVWHSGHLQCKKELFVGCGWTDILDLPGFLNSPNYPENYPAKLDCTWDIWGDVGNVIKVDFWAFDVIFFLTKSYIWIYISYSSLEIMTESQSMAENFLPRLVIGLLCCPEVSCQTRYILTVNTCGSSSEPLAVTVKDSVYNTVKCMLAMQVNIYIFCVSNPYYNTFFQLLKNKQKCLSLRVINYLIRKGHFKLFSCSSNWLLLFSMDWERFLRWCL